MRKMRQFYEEWKSIAICSFQKRE
ncbi:MAG: hypothetical protein J6B11_08920 [Spirochaetales bacterium]|nr:hypothetical protein [Spirochaetales bacterium]